MQYLILILQILAMNWYIAKVVLKISSQQSLHTPQFDEQFRLINANSTEEAFLKARVIGLHEENEYTGSDRKVKWEFINVADVVPVRDLSDGAEIYSQVHETRDAKDYIHAVHEKAIFIRKNLNN